MRKFFERFSVVAVSLALVATAAWAVPNVNWNGFAGPYWYGFSAGAESTYYLSFPTLSANDEAAGIAATQTLTNKSIDSDNNTITNIVNADIKAAAAIANSKLAAGNSYFTVAINHDGQETATVNPIKVFQMPFAATLVEVSAGARDIDTTDANETYTIDIEDDGTTTLSAAIAIVADATPVVGTVSAGTIADNSVIEAVLTIGGTTPTIDDITVLLTFKVAHTS